MTIRAHDATRLAWPTDWNETFGRSAPLFMEIGFGNAQFLIDWAKREPDVNLLGIEISLPSIRKAESKIKNENLGYTQVIHGNARLVLQSSVSLETLDQLYLNFPDPWHKASHHHRKLINDSFLHLVATRMKVGGLLDIATDDPGYQEAITECLERTPYFTSRTGETFALDDEQRIRTKYELKALAAGRTCQYYKWVRNETPAPNIFPHPQELDMPHVVLTNTISFAEMSARFTQQRYGGDTPVRLLRMYESLTNDEKQDTSLLVETHVAEDPLPQRIGLLLQKRSNNEVLLGVAELGFPRPTEGVHVAVASLAHWVLGLDSKTAVKHHNLNCPIPAQS